MKWTLRAQHFDANADEVRFIAISAHDRIATIQINLSDSAMTVTAPDQKPYMQAALAVAAAGFLDFLNCMTAMTSLPGTISENYNAYTVEI